jgi:hypothetical protein
LAGENQIATCNLFRLHKGEFAVKDDRLASGKNRTLSLPCRAKKKQNLAHMKTTTRQFKPSMNRLLCQFALLIAFALACFVVLSTAQAVIPPPDGGYPNENTAEGTRSLYNLTIGAANTAIGFQALFHDTTGSQNTASGDGALFNNRTGFANTALGWGALTGNTTGGNNTASGNEALYRNTSGFSNTATGMEALYVNTTGNSNTATGQAALFSNTTGNDNTSTGVYSLFANSTGSSNTADGVEALYNNTTGTENTASGYGALNQDNTGSYNTATGVSALESNITGNHNTASGVSALYSNNRGSYNIAIGDSAGFNLTTGDHNIDIGNDGVAGESSTIRIGGSNQTNTYIAGISGATVPSGVAVIVDSGGHLGTVTSSARYKGDIRPMDKASEAVLGLQPVTFHYKKELDPKAIPQFGLVAEQVEKIDPDLVAHDEQGKPYTVRYDAVNAMLLNEFLKEHRTVQEQGATITELKKQIAALTAGLQKVSAQLEVSKSAPQTVLNNQ